MLRKSSFEHYRLNQHIIERLTFDPCIVSDTVTGCSVDPPYTRHTIRVSGVSEWRKQRNQRIIDELSARCAEVDVEIATMQDRRLAQILLLRYVDGTEEPEWEDIAPEIGLHADNCRKAAKKYLDSLEVVRTEGFRKRTKRKAVGFK